MDLLSTLLLVILFLYVVGINTKINLMMEAFEIDDFDPSDDEPDEPDDSQPLNPDGTKKEDP